MPVRAVGDSSRWAFRQPLGPGAAPALRVWSRRFSVRSLGLHSAGIAALAASSSRAKRSGSSAGTGTQQSAAMASAVSYVRSGLGTLSSVCLLLETPSLVTWSITLAYAASSSPAGGASLSGRLPVVPRLYCGEVLYKQVFPLCSFGGL